MPVEKLELTGAASFIRAVELRISGTAPPFLNNPPWIVAAGFGDHIQVNKGSPLLLRDSLLVCEPSLSMGHASELGERILDLNCDSRWIENKVD